MASIYGETWVINAASRVIQTMHRRIPTSPQTNTTTTGMSKRSNLPADWHRESRKTARARPSCIYRRPRNCHSPSRSEHHSIHFHTIILFDSYTLLFFPCNTRSTNWFSAFCYTSRTCLAQLLVLDAMHLSGQLAAALAVSVATAAPSSLWRRADDPLGPYLGGLKDRGKCVTHKYETTESRAEVWDAARGSEFIDAYLNNNPREGWTTTIAKRLFPDQSAGQLDGWSDQALFTLGNHECCESSHGQST